MCGVGEGACMAGETAAASDDMHPTGMHFCAYVMFLCFMTVVALCSSE